MLLQPFAPPSQQHMKLKSRWAFITAGSERRSCLLELPLPNGDADDPRDFHLYLSLPNRKGTLPVALENDGAARGFFIQEVGHLSGKTKFVGGTVRHRHVFLHPTLRRLDLDVQCADGTTIVGQAYAKIDERELRRFEREFADDIADLCSGQTPSDERVDTTAPRNQPGP